MLTTKTIIIFYNIFFPFFRNVSLRYSKVFRSSPKKSNFSRSWMCKIQIFQCYFDNNNTKQVVIKNSQKMIKTVKKNRKQKALNSLSESETIDKSQTASKQNQQRINKQQKSNILSVIAYTIVKKEKKIKPKKNLLASLIMYNVWNSKIVPIMNVFFSIALYFFRLLLPYPL